MVDFIREEKRYGGNENMNANNKDKRRQEFDRFFMSIFMLSVWVVLFDLSRNLLDGSLQALLTYLFSGTLSALAVFWFFFTSLTRIEKLNERRPRHA
jgi:hypothetical protein